MDQWEYYSTMLKADMRDVDPQDPDVPAGEHPRHSPHAITPALNDLGRAGWELVSAEPVKAGRKNDFVMPAGDAALWGHHYFCVFKRRLA